MPREASSTSPAAISPEELARAGIYRLLASLLSRPADQWVLGLAAAMGGDGGAFGETLAAISAKAKGAKPPAIEREFNALFIGVSEGELVPYGSYYLTGFLHEKPLARLRRDMAALGVARAADVAEPEDSMASLCEIMGGLITGAFGAPAPLDVQQSFFEAHLGPWAERFFTDLEAAPSADFYQPVGALGTQFMALEATAFSMAA